MFRKVFNKQFIEWLKAISIINKTQLQTPTDCFTPSGDHQGDFIQKGLANFNDNKTMTLVEYFKKYEYKFQ